MEVALRVTGALTGLLALDQADLAAALSPGLPDQICDHLIAFFRRHYADGRLVTNSHRDQYYVKTDDGRRDILVHKDLGGFLRDALGHHPGHEDPALHRAAAPIIDALARREEARKQQWLTKRPVVETHYCITLDQIPDAFLPAVAASDAQRDEWVSLCDIDRVPLTPEFLRARGTLMLDTRHFPAEFTDRLLESLGDIDDRTDGVLVHGENFHALSLMQRRLERRVACIYIDPPYNTGGPEIPYKNSYARTSWLMLMENRLDLATSLLAPDPVLFIAVDDFEMVTLSVMIDTRYPRLKREMIIVNHHPQGGKARTLAHTHEYMLTCVDRTSRRTLAGRAGDNAPEQRPFKRSGTAESNYRRKRPNSFYAILVDPRTGMVVGAEPPPVGDDYPQERTAEGYERIYPIGARDDERVWRRAFASGAALIAQGRLRASANGTIYQRIESHERTPALFSNWIGRRYSAGTFGANLLRDILGVSHRFFYPKSVHTVEDAIYAATLDDDAFVLDYFAGSGTTGHAVINLNREDGRRRKFILVESADYFDRVLLARIKKVTFAPEWKEGRPARHASPTEAARSPRIVKVIRLDDGEQQPPDTVDRMETFNWLIGLTVRSITGPSSFRTVAGMLPDGRNALVIWRTLTDDRAADNRALYVWFAEAYPVRDTAPDVIYVNGENDLERARTIEDDYARLIRETDSLSDLPPRAMR